MFYWKNYWKVTDCRIQYENYSQDLHNIVLLFQRFRAKSVPALDTIAPNKHEVYLIHTLVDPKKPQIHHQLAFQPPTHFVEVQFVRTDELDGNPLIPTDCPKSRSLNEIELINSTKITFISRLTFRPIFKCFAEHSITISILTQNHKFVFVSRFEICNGSFHHVSRQKFHCTPFSCFREPIPYDVFKIWPYVPCKYLQTEYVHLKWLKIFSIQNVYPKADLIWYLMYQIINEKHFECIAHFQEFR